MFHFASLDVVFTGNQLLLHLVNLWVIHKLNAFIKTLEKNKTEPVLLNSGGFLVATDLIEIKMIST